MGIRARNVDKIMGEPPTQVLWGVSVDIDDGDFVSLTGRSGAGKSTLLYLLSSLDGVTRGSVEVDGREINRMTPREVSRFRNEHMGFVFQFHYLIAELSALDNVLLPARKTDAETKYRRDAEELLHRFGLGEKLHRLPRQLSGGEQQRVAIARALVMRPRYLFADEPTGSLDSANGEIVMNILKETNERFGTTIVLVTHDPDYAAMARRQIHMADGRIVA